ncbi:MAG: carbon-nitrogen hydrolase family protein [Terriglobia bacterium]
MSNGMKRREFLRDSAAGVAGVAAEFGGSSLRASPAEGENRARDGTSGNEIGRPVRVASIGFHPGRPLEEIVSLVDREGNQGTDLIALPETCRGQDETSQETLEGPTVTAMARLARKHRTYIVCPIDRKHGDQRFNSAVFLNREGKVVCIYNKMFPVWASECMKNHVLPGEQARVYQADFGRVGLAICFDVNWSPIWETLANHGAELVIWPSAYSAGRSLQARAIAYNYSIVSATWTPDCLVYDIDGSELAHETDNQKNGTNITRATLDLDRCIFHQDLNLPEKLARLLHERGQDVAREKWMPLEGWFVLKARRPGVSARKLAREYGLEELRHYINRSRCEIDKCRGWEFS